MIKLINIDNPKITIAAPDKLIREVGGNCWQLGGTQPLTFPKHLWRTEVEQEPQGLDEAAEYYASNYPAYNDEQVIAKYAFKRGAEWQMANAIRKEMEKED